MARAPTSIRRTSIGHLYRVMPRHFGDGQHRQETQHPPATDGLLARKLFRAFARTVPRRSSSRTPRPRYHLWICQRVRGATDATDPEPPVAIGRNCCCAPDRPQVDSTTHGGKTEEGVSEGDPATAGVAPRHPCNRRDATAIRA